jgi:2-polyprenyl-3-methyl-5-hydroxy-6-metoxy-1,4-benzoquinol methylase
MQRDNTMTRRFLADAGVTNGMRVIEIGCGGGEVTQLLAELVGPSGFVVALDRDQSALASARERLREKGINHVQFVSADVAGQFTNLETFAYESFDVLAGRRVLMYLPSPPDTLRRLARWVRSDGLVVFEETDSTMIPGRISAMPAHDQATEWCKKMLLAEGANIAMGFWLPTTFTQAGLEVKRIRAEAVIQGQGTQYPLSALLRLVQTRIITAGIATAAEIDTLVHRLNEESHNPLSVYISEMSFCAWAAKP